MRNELDLRELFESKICSNLINNETFLHSYQYPGFHRDKSRKTARYQGKLINVLYGRNCYNVIFGETFGNFITIPIVSQKGYLQQQNSMHKSVKALKEE